MIEFLRMFRSLKNFRGNSFEYEECGRTETSRVFAIYGKEKRSGERAKVCEIVCDLDEKICQKKVERAIWKLNHLRGKR